MELNCLRTKYISLPQYSIRCNLRVSAIELIEKKNQLDATEWFIALVICSTCFGHLYAHHRGLETILVLLPHMVCNALVAGGRRSGAGRQATSPADSLIPDT
jgi:hypothetical protein